MAWIKAAFRNPTLRNYSDSFTLIVVKISKFLGFLEVKKGRLWSLMSIGTLRNGPYPLDVPVQPISCPSNSPLTSISLQSREKDIVKDCVKCFTEIQINDICPLPLSTHIVTPSQKGTDPFFHISGGTLS